MKMSASEYIKLPYTVIIIPDEDVFFVKIKELPGCISQGDTIAEAYEMIEEAKQLWIEAALDDGYDFPLPESMQEAKYSGKLSLRISKSLHRKLTLKAKEDSVSLNQYINNCLVEQSTIDLISGKMIKSQDKLDDSISTLDSISVQINSNLDEVNSRENEFKYETNSYKLSRLNGGNFS